MPDILNPDPAATPPAPTAAAGSDAAPATDVTPGSSPADASAASSAADVQPAASSAADGVDRQSLLDVTKAALAASKPKDAQDSPSGNGQDTGKPAADSQATTTPEDKKSPDADGKDKTSEPDADDDFSDAAKLDFGKHPRFQKLLTQWNRDKEPAGQFRKLTTFLDDEGVTQTQAAQALKLAALLTHAQRGSVEHAKLFLADVAPVFTQLRQLTGEEIAPDLKERLSSGAIDEPSARELTQQREQTEAAKRRDEDSARRDESQQAATLRTDIVKAVSDWDAGVRGRDPDFSRKEQLIKSRIQAITVEEGPPTTAKAALALAERAYKDVNKSFDGLVPAPPPTPTSRKIAAPARAVPPGQVRPAAKTPVDITRQALGIRTA